MSAWSSFLTAHAVLIQALEARSAEAGLPPLVWYDALWALERAPEQRLRISEFEQSMVISRSNITRLVDRLEQAGLVARERSEEDRRGAFAVLTAEGRKMRKRIWSVYGPAIDELFDSRLSEAQHRHIEQAMLRLIAAHRATEKRAG